MASIITTNGDLPSFVQKVSDTLKDVRATVDLGRSGVSMESFASNGIAGVQTGLVTVRNSIAAAWENHMGPGHILTDGQLDAAAFVAVGMPGKGSNMLGFNQRFTSTESFNTARSSGMTFFGIPEARGGAAPFDYQMDRREISNEVFDARQLDNFMATSITYHILAARQSAAAEALYPTYAVPPDGTGFVVSVERTLVFNQILHSHDADAIKYDENRKLLLNAAMDSSILRNKATKVIPFREDGNVASTRYFADPLLLPPTLVTQDDAQDLPFETAPLKPDTEFNLLNVGSNPAITRLGQQNTTDTIDHRVTLEKVYLRVVSSAVGNPTSILAINTSQVHGSQFNPAAEGSQRKMVLTFDTNDIPVFGGMLDASGAPAAALAELTVGQYANMRVRLQIDINGRINLEDSLMKVNGSSATVHSVVSVTGVGVNAVIEPVKDPLVLSAIVAMFDSITMIGYDLDAYRTNVNRRQIGQLVTKEAKRDMHIIPMGPPTSALVPIIDSASHTVDVTGPAACTMLRNTNNAFSQLFTFEDTLMRAQLAYDTGSAVTPSIRAIGRYVLRRPWYGYELFDVSNEINSTKTHERNLDLQSAITNKLRWMINQGYYYTNMQAAMDVLTPTVGQRPIVRVVGNPIALSYLITTGDTRTFGDGWKFEVVPDQDLRFIDRDGANDVYRLYAVFALPGQDGPHPLNFGNMVYQPDVVTNLPITRDQSTTVEFTIQPKTLHVNHTPIMFRLDLAGLSGAATERTPYEMVIV